jgi:exonuclease SbcD
MRLLHTSDWHLGHTLKDVTREREHAAFLAWLVETLADERPDILIITGDVFDSATPPASAERMWFEFLATTRRAHPAMDIVAIAGNHDSPARLSASESVLRELSVHVIGSVPRLPNGQLDIDRILIPVARSQGLVAAVPFLRPNDLPWHSRVGSGAAERSGPSSPGGADPVAEVYGEVIERARVLRGAEQALVVLGHLYVTGADPSMLSERRISIGGQEAASPRLFPSDIDYVALGHMHRAQRVGRDSIRYAGAPIALALDEASYRHQVVAVDFASGRVVDIRPIAVPQAIDIVRIPARGAAPLPEVISAIEALPSMNRGEDAARPYLDLMISLDQPEPRLRALIERALDGKLPRLVQLRVTRRGDGMALGDRESTRRLAELDPRDVFKQLWARSHAEPPSEAIASAFDRLLAEVRGDLEDPAQKRADSPQLQLGGVV